MVRIILRNSFKGLGIRALSALVLGPIAFAGVWLGGYFFAALISIIAVIVSWEWGYLVSQKSPRLITVLGSGLSLLGIFAVSSQQASWVIGAYIACIAILSLVLGVCLRKFDQDTRTNAAWSAAGLFYLCLCVLAMTWIRLGVPHGQWFSLWLLAVVWAADIGAYIAGRLIGGPKFAPRISPQKTWSGFWGGTLMGIAISVVVTLTHGQSFWLFVLLGCVIAVAAHLGDLLESAAKRHFGAKDMSQIIPGHGGLLDRIDGLIMAALIFAVLIWLGEEGGLTWQ